MRNVGGSVGISIVNTILARHGQVHQTELLHNMQSTSPLFQQSLNQTTQMLSRTYGPADAAIRAYAVMSNNLGLQATLWSYVDDLRYMAFASIACVPLVWALKKVKPKEPINAH